MTTTEQQIAAALSARAGGITMDTIMLEKRFQEVRDRGARDRQRRRWTALGAAAVATAAAVLAGFAIVGGVPWQDEAAPYADREVAQLSEPYLVGDGRPEPGRTYSVADVPVPLTFDLPPLGGVPGTWGYRVDDGLTVGLERSPSTGHANLVVTAVDRTYDPEQPQPFGPGTVTVPAPTDADGWASWIERTGAAVVTEREELVIGGVPATRLTLDVADDVPASGFPCARGESCLAASPDGPTFVGEADSTPFLSELTVLDVEGRTVLAAAIGAQDSAGEWLPLMRSIIDSLRFA